jgi:hypothetical protein
MRYVYHAARNVKDSLIMVDRRQAARAIDRPEPCFVRLRLSPHGPWVPARVFVRLGLLLAEIDGTEAPVESVWTSGDRITEREWLDLVRDRSRARPF